MTLEEAIRVNDLLKKAPVLKDDPVVIAALNLSIEALKRLQESRDGHYLMRTNPLPSETKD